MPSPSPRSNVQTTASSKPRRKRRGRQFFGGVLLGLILGSLSLYFYVRAQLGPASETSTPTEFEVLPGWGGKRVAAELENAELINDALTFSYFLRYEGLDRSIGEGLYDLDPAMDAATIAQTLAEGGRPRTTFVVLPEGFRLVDIAAELAEAGFGDEAELLELMRAPGPLRPDYVPEGTGLEGYLFPAGYAIPLGTEPEGILEQMLTRFDKELTEDTLNALQEHGLSVHDWVTLASIIQAEAADASEMPIIAGVFLNRLDRGMLLQSDPTVAYGLGKDLPELDAVAGDMQSDTPWNTYLYGALPPSPINSPGSEALQAVFNPARHNADGQDYLYFLHGIDEGQLVFRPNLSLEAHNRDVRRYLR